MGKKGSFEVILGCYEEFIVGFKYNKKEEGAQQTFAVHSHTGSVRCVTSSGDLLASGGADDRIVVYDLKTRRECCHLNHHNGTVNCLAFTNDTHLISGGQDGMLAITRVGTWQLQKIWQNAHKGAAILDIALHSSGKLAITLGADATLRTWNLVKGRQAYVVNLNNKSKEPKCLHSIKWAPDGQRFVLVGNTYTDIWSIDTGGALKSIKHNYKISSCIWHSDEQLIVGYEDGKFGVVNVESEEISLHEAHDSRVKCMALHGKKLITASSTGEIKVWSQKFKQLCVANPECRFTCIHVISLENQDVQEINESVVDANDSLVEDVVEVRNVKSKKRVSVQIEGLDDEIEEVPIVKKSKKKVKKGVVGNDEVIVVKKVVLKKDKKKKKKVQSG